jgi:hypothetical protein
MQRSGTTLLDKLLDNHRRLSLLSQPFPLLFVEVKRRFLRQLNVEEDPYPLGDLFLEDRYQGEDLRLFLDDLILSRPDLRVLCDSSGFSGQYTRFSAERLDQAVSRIEPGNAARVLAQLYRELAHDEDADWFGGKETLWEEFLPFLLDHGFAVVLILRDPRDVLASLNHGRGTDYAGRVKPTLFNVRNWRKSVAYALHLEQHPRFLWLRYEDLVHRPAESLGRIAELLEVEPFAQEIFRGQIRGRDGQPWSGNSSHTVQAGIDSSSVGRHQELLPPGVARYVEAACWPELRFLGYRVDLDWAQIPAVLSGFSDPYPVVRPELGSYAETAARSEEELRRRELLLRGGEEECRRNFLFADVCARLRTAVPG